MLRIRTCRFCKGKNAATAIDFKNIELLRNFITEKGKIFPRRISGCCAKHQRMVAASVKQARHAALLPFQAE